MGSLAVDSFGWVVADGFRWFRMVSGGFRWFAVLVATSHGSKTLIKKIAEKQSTEIKHLFIYLIFVGHIQSSMI